MTSDAAASDSSDGLIERQKKRKEAERSALEARKAEILSRQEWETAWVALCGRVTDSMVISWDESREPLVLNLAEIVQRRGFGEYVERIETRIHRWFEMERPELYQNPVRNIIIGHLDLEDTRIESRSSHPVEFENIQAAACVLRRAIHGIKPLVPVGMCVESLRSTVWWDLQFAMDDEITEKGVLPVEPIPREVADIKRSNAAFIEESKRLAILHHPQIREAGDSNEAAEVNRSIQEFEVAHEYLKRKHPPLAWIASDVWIQDWNDSKEVADGISSNEEIPTQQTPRQVKSHGEASRTVDGLYADERCLIWDGERYERLTRKMVEILEVFVDQFNRGFPVVNLDLIFRRTGKRFDGGFIGQAFKQNRKGSPPLHNVHVVIEKVSDGEYRLLPPSENNS